MKKIAIRLIVLLVLAAVAYGGYTAYKKIPQERQDQIPTAKVRQNDILVKTYARGELQAVRSAPLTAPNLFGTVQVTRLAAMGAFAKEKDLIVEFDDSELLSRIEEKQLALDQLDEQIKKAEADLAVRDNQDKVDMLSAQYGVRRAELQVKQNPILAEIDKKKNLLALDEANERLRELKVDVQSRKEQAEAQLADLRQQRQKGVFDLQREKQRLTQVKMLSPIQGLVAIKQNRGQNFIYGQTIPDIREGDQVQPGIQIAEIMDLSELQVLARVGELDRANLVEGQDVVMRLDALADVNLHGKIKSMSGTASANVFSSDPAKKFDVVFSVDMKQLLTALGAKPEQIARVLAAAEANKNKNVPGMGPSTLTGAADAPGGDEAAAAGGGRGGRGGRRAPEGADNGGGGRGGRNRGDAGGDAAAGGGRRNRGGDGSEVAGGGGRGGRGGRGGPGGPGGDFTGGFGMGGGRGAGRYTQAELDAAELPPPPEENNQLEVLMRPGLLADVEIIVEKIPNAIHVPVQAIFQREGKMVAFVKQGPRLVPRDVKILKRSESTMVISGGLQPGEEVALQDPEAQTNSKKQGSKGGGPAPLALPGK